MRQAYDALVSGDIPGLFSLMDDDVSAHVPGRSQVAGDYAGKQAVLGYVAKLGELSGGTLRFELHELLTGGGHTGQGHTGEGHTAEGHTGEGHGHGHAVALVKDLAERADGRSLAMNNVHVWHVGDGRLRTIWIYPGDLYAWDDFWS
jgi:ketosteroid isomerase-like protein